jgi:hypothetical protein
MFSIRQKFITILDLSPSILKSFFYLRNKLNRESFKGQLFYLTELKLMVLKLKMNVDDSITRLVRDLTIISLFNNFILRFGKEIS